MKTVLMEVRFRVCATPERLQHFVDHATRIVASEIPARTKFETTRAQTTSVLLRRQWDRFNDATTLPTPQLQEIGFGFCDPTGRLTAARVESIANSILAQLTTKKPAGYPAGENLSWILTVNTAGDHASRLAIAHCYPHL